MSLKNILIPIESNNLDWMLYNAPLIGKRTYHDFYLKAPSSFFVEFNNKKDKLRFGDAHKNYYRHHSKYKKQFKFERPTSNFITLRRSINEQILNPSDEHYLIKKIAKLHKINVCFGMNIELAFKYNNTNTVVPKITMKGKGCEWMLDALAWNYKEEIDYGSGYLSNNYSLEFNDYNDMTMFVLGLTDSSCILTKSAEKMKITCNRFNSNFEDMKQIVDQYGISLKLKTNFMLKNY